MSFRIELPFATPSQNQYDRMDRYTRSHLVTSYASHITLALRGDQRVRRWSLKLPLGFRAFCTRAKCRGEVNHTDPRGCGWCAEHGDELAAAKRTVKVTRLSAGELDQGNLVGGCKPLLDALVRVGLLYDDKNEWCAVEYDQGKAPRGQGSTVVEVHI